MDQLECAQPTTTTCPTAVPRRCARCSTHCRPSRATTARWRNGRSRCSTERTLARHCQRELGMTFGEWRQRLRFLAAIEALEAGRGSSRSPSTSAGSPSAFISMFRRLAPPEQYRLASRAQTMPLPPCMRCGYARSSHHPEFACQPPAAIRHRPRGVPRLPQAGLQRLRRGPSPTSAISATSSSAAAAG